MPLIVLFLLLLAAVFLLDNRIIFRILFVVVNLWLTVMYFVIAEIQTAKLPQVPWFDPAGVSGTVVVYLALLMTAAGVLLFFLSRLLFVSRLPAVFPFIGAACSESDCCRPAPIRRSCRRRRCPDPAAFAYRFCRPRLPENF